MSINNLNKDVLEIFKKIPNTTFSVQFSKSGRYSGVSLEYAEKVVGTGEHIISINEDGFQGECYWSLYEAENALSGTALELLKKGIPPSLTWDIDTLLDDANISNYEDEDSIFLDSSTSVICTVKIGKEQSSFSKRIAFTLQLLSGKFKNAEFVEMPDWSWNEHEGMTDSEAAILDYLHDHFNELMLPNWESDISPETKESVIQFSLQETLEC